MFRLQTLEYGSAKSKRAKTLNILRTARQSCPSTLQRSDSRNNNLRAFFRFVYFFDHYLLCQVSVAIYLCHRYTIINALRVHLGVRPQRHREAQASTHIRTQSGRRWLVERHAALPLFSTN
jgi:hypothetical protein